MKGGKKKRKKELDNKTTTSINNSNRTTTDIPWFSFSIFFDQHNLVISNRCSRAGSVLHLILVLDIFDVSIIYSGSHRYWYRRTVEQNRRLPISPMPSMMLMMQRYSGSVKGNEHLTTSPSLELRPSWWRTLRFCWITLVTTILVPTSSIEKELKMKREKKELEKRNK